MSQETDKTGSEDVKPEEEMTAEELAALTADEDFIANFKDEDKSDPEKVTKLNEAILRSAQTTVHQKRHYREALKKAKEGPKPGTPEAAPEGATGPTGATGPAPKEEVKGIDPVVALTFRQDHPELSKEAAKVVLEHAAKTGDDPEEALKSPMVKSYLKSLVDAADLEGASPAPSNRSGSGIADKDWSTATPEEIAAERNRVMMGS